MPAKQCNVWQVFFACREWIEWDFDQEHRSPIRLHLLQAKNTLYRHPNGILSWYITSWPFIYFQLSELLTLLLEQCLKAVTDVCQINSCGQTFASTRAYESHVNDFHKILRGKQGDEKIRCPWDSCGEIIKKSSIWNFHITGHNTTTTCCICHTVRRGIREDSMKKHIKQCYGMGRLL